VLGPFCNLVRVSLEISTKEHKWMELAQVRDDCRDLVVDMNLESLQ